MNANTATAAPGQKSLREQPFQVDQALHSFSLGPKRENELGIFMAIDGSKEIGYPTQREPQFELGLALQSKEPATAYN